jgi:hypothetical protein
MGDQLEGNLGEEVDIAAEEGDATIAMDGENEAAMDFDVEDEGMLRDGDNGSTDMMDEGEDRAMGYQVCSTQLECIVH